MARLANVRMRSMLLLVQFLSTCSGIEFKEPDEYSCEKERVSPTGKSPTCMCESGKCTLSVKLGFGHVAIPEARTGLHGPLHMLGFNTPGEDGLPFEVNKTMYVNGTSPGPTLRVRAGDTLRILLHNNLPHEWVDTGSIEEGMHSFDTVNLHTHGLHTSPRAPGDEIIHTRVGPNEMHQYVYNIPDDHMGGTHWYHPHWHGAVTIHVNFGAAGMLIVEDAVNQLPDELRYKDSSTDNLIMEDYIVAAFHVDFNDTTRITNKYVKNCICMNTAECHKCQSFFDRKKPKECNEFDMLCIQQGCKVGTNKDTSMCAAQAAPFFVNPEDFPHTNDNLLLVNGQFEPKLNITANTWVRLRLGLMATGKVL